MILCQILEKGWGDLKARGINIYSALIWLLLFYMTANMTTALLPQGFSLNRLIGVGIVVVSFYILFKNIVFY